MTYRIPTQGQFSQPNKGDLFGNLKGTLNADLRTNPGRFRLSPRMTVITKDDDVTNFGLPIAFETLTVSSTEVNFAATGAGGQSSSGTGKMFKNAAVGFGAFTAVGSSPTTINDAHSDMVSWSGKETSTFKRIYVSTYGGSSHDISQYDGSSWANTWYTSTRSGSGLVNGAPVHLCPGFNGKLYIAQEFQIMYAPITGSIVVPSSTTDPNTTNGTIHTLGKYHIVWIRSSSNRLWIGLVESSSGSKSHQGGFVAEWDAGATTSTQLQFNKIYKIDAPMAMSCTIVNDIPYIIDAYGVLRKFTGAGFMEVARLPVANLNTEMPGIYAPYNNVRWIHPRGMTNNGNMILINVNNFVSSGVYVEEMPSGIWAFDTNNPSEGIYHRNSPCATSSDYGQQYIKDAGAIYPLRVTGGDYLAGVSYYTDNTTTNRLAIFYDDVSTNTNKRGSFITPFISSDQIEDTWQRVNYRHSTIPSGDKIVGKYRNFKNTNYPFNAAITWASTTTLTSTDANFANVVDGDEVEVTMGKGASSTAHVSGTPSYSNPTYTVTLDEAIGFSSGTARARIDNFRKMSTLSVTGETNGEMQIGKEDTKVQIKTEIRATGNFELDDLTIVNKNFKLSK